MSDYNLLEVSEMGIADFLRSTKYTVPKWMNTNEARAYKVGFERGRDMCKSPRTKRPN